MNSTKIDIYSAEKIKTSVLGHGPPPDEQDNLQANCTVCPKPSPEFTELWDIIENIVEKSNNGENTTKEIDQLKKKLGQKPYRECLNMHNSTEEGECDTLLHLASDYSHKETMKVLLEAGADPNTANRRSQLPLHSVVDGGDGCYCKECSALNATCVELLLEYKSSMEVDDYEGDSLLANCALAMMPDCADVLWRRGASIHKKGLGKGSVPGEVLATYLPNQVKAWFDHAIQQQRNDRLHLTIDFGPLLGRRENSLDQDMNETAFLTYISNGFAETRKDLLLHPLSQAYIYLKWQGIRRLFLLLRLLYLCSTIIYSYFILRFFVYNCPYETLMKKVQQPGNRENIVKCSATVDTCIVAVFILLFGVVVTTNAIYEMSTIGLKRYVRVPLNLGWWAFILATIANVLAVVTGICGHWQYVCAAVGVFLAWGMFMSQLARDPKIGIYVEMLGTILKKFVLFSIAYLTLVIGFAMSFAVLFPDNPMLKYLYGFLPFVKAVLMINGEMDYENLFGDKNPRASELGYSIGAHVIYVGFIVVGPIILMNLLVGLTISDVQELVSSATLTRTEGLVGQIDLLETLIRRGWVPRKVKNWYARICSIESICDGLGESDYMEKEDGKSSKEREQYNRAQGPYLKDFEPLRQSEDRLPQKLKEQLISYIDVDKCAKKIVETVLTRTPVRDGAQ